MKLHLPKPLLLAVLACFVASASWADTTITDNTTWADDITATTEAVTVSGATLTVNAQTLDLTNGGIVVTDGGLLDLHFDNANNSDLKASIFGGPIVLNAANMNIFAAEHTVADLSIIGESTMSTTWGYGATISKLTGDAGAVLNISTSNSEHRAPSFVLEGDGAYAGTIRLLSPIAGSNVPVLSINSADAVNQAKVELSSGTKMTLTDSVMANVGSVQLASGSLLSISDNVSDTNRLSNISGAGTVEVSLTNDYSNTLNLGTNFTGETYVRVGNFTLTNAKVGNTIRLGNNVEGQTTANNTQFGANIVLEGNAGVHANSDKSITYNGTVTGIVRDGVTQGVFKSKGSSSHTFNNTVNLAGFDTENVAGVTFNGQLTLGYLTADYESATVKVNNDATIGTVTQDKATLTFGGEDVTVTISEKLHSKRGTLNIGSSEGGAVFVSAARLEAGDSDNATFNTTLNIYNGSTLKITGSTDSSDYKTTSLLISEWRGGSTLNVEGSLLAQNATLMLGDSRDAGNNPYDTIINVGATGTIAVKGIKNSKEGESLGTLKLTILDGGKLILGANGFSTPKAVEAKIGAATIGISADSVTISEAMTLTSADGAIFDTQKYAFATDGNSIAQTEAGGTLTVSEALSGDGGVVKAGAGNLVFTRDHTYTGTTDIRAGSLVLNLGANGIYTLDNDVTGDGTLQVNAGTTVKTEGHNVQSALYLNGGSLMVTAAGSADDAILPTSPSVVVSDNASITFTKALSTSSDLTITGGAGSVTLSGEQNTIKGALTIAEGTGLTLDADSSLTVNSPIQNNGNLDIQGTVNWDLASTEGLTVTYSEAELSRPDNGLGAGVISGLITGNGTLVDNGNVAATVNDKTGTLATGTGLVTADDVVYYVMDCQSSDEGGQYAVNANQFISANNVVNVGNNTFESGPVATDGVNSALGFYLGENGVLCISGDSDKLTASDILVNTQGTGSIILRSAGVKNETDATGVIASTLYVDCSSATSVTGALYITPQILLNKAGNPVDCGHVEVSLNDGADISSFSSIMLGNETHIRVKGEIGRANENIGHFNNVGAYGNSQAYIIVENAISEEIVLGGITSLSSCDFGTGTDPSGSMLYLKYAADGQIRINALTDGAYGEQFNDTSLVLQTDNAVNGKVYIDSFKYSGEVFFYGINGGTLHAEINLLDDEILNDIQCVNSGLAVDCTETLLIKGAGRYVLSEGSSIDVNQYNSIFRTYNFGVLDSNWTGTVEVNNLDASGTVSQIQGIKIADYGNENSTIHFKGFKGYLTDDATAVEIEQDLILENTYKEEDDSLNMNAYEITGGYEGQDQTYKGNISGTGDFVVSADENMTFNLQGDLSEWKDGAELKVTAGTQDVNFSDAATVINADVLATNGATMNADISNTKAVTVNGKVKADGGTLNLSVNTAQGTTFTNEVNVTKISVGSGSTAKLEAASSAGNISIGSYGEGKAALSNGLTIEGNTVGHGYIADAMISHIQKAGTVELVEVSASNLYLYGGKQVQFHSTDSKNQFKFDKQISYGSERVNEVVFTSDIFSGMILSKDGAQLTLTVDNAVVWDDAVQPDWTNVTIELKGFTIEQLAGTAGDWDWDKFGLSFDPNSASVATLDNAALSTTVSELLNADYDFVVYEQNASGLTIRMYNTPEPTTATLSMLALAALAARRRRRK